MSGVFFASSAAACFSIIVILLILFTDFLTVGAEHHLFKETISAFRIYPESITGSGRYDEACKIDMNRIFKKYKKRKFNYFDNVVNIYQRILNKIT